MTYDRRVIRLLGGSLLAVVAWHTIGLLIARQFELSLVYLLPLTAALYATIAGMVARHSTWHLGVLAAVVAAVVDLLVGTPVAWLIGAELPPEKVTVQNLADMAYGAAMFASIGGFVGAPIGAYIRARRPPSGPAAA